MPEKRIYGFLKSFPLGINSDVDPLLLPPTQLSFLSNGTVRGDFVKQRSCTQKFTLSYDKPATQTAFQLATTLFQGAAYFYPGLGLECLMLAVGGKLYRLVLGTTPNTATISAVALPDSGDSTTAVIHWLWQSEKWLIWNDGIALPMFYNGTTARRSLGSSPTTLATVGTNGYVVPPVGSYVSVPLSAAYSGQVGIPVLIGQAMYFLQSVGSTSTQGGTAINFSSTQLAGSGSDTIASGAKFVTNTKYAGWITAASVLTWPSNQPGNPTTVQITLGVQLTNPVGTSYHISTTYDSGVTICNGKITAVDGTGYVLTLSILNLYENNYAWTSSNAFFFNGSALSFTPVGFSIYPAPTTGVPTFTLTLSQNFSGNLNDTLTQGTAQFTVTAGIGTPTITCQMVNTPGGGPTIYTGTLPGPYSSLVLDSTTQTTSTVATYNGATPTNPSQGSITVSVAISGGILVTASSSGPAVGMIVATGSDLLYITSVGGNTGGTNTPYAYCQNQNDTSGTTVAAGAVISSIPELPVGRMGAYGMGRNWMCLADGKSFVAGDLVGAPSGSLANNYLDAVLKVSQNYFLAGGGTFKLPGAGTQIQAMKFVASLDASLGQGPLQVLTQNNIFSCNAPADMTTWASMTSPILTESLIGSGGISQDAVIQENCDLIFRTIDGDVRSMLMARLDFNLWGNTPISREVIRSLQNDLPGLLPFDTNIVFDNRMLLACQPIQSTRAVYHQALVVLNYDPLSSMQNKQPAVWDGEWDAPNILKLVDGFFGGVHRCFAICLSTDLTTIELHEILKDGAAINDDGTTEVTWFFESPSLFDHKLDHEYKRLIDGEIAIDQIQSDLTITAYYKPDQYPNWVQWFTVNVNYQGTTDPGFRPRIGLGLPSATVFDPVTNRPLREGFNYQTKLVITGYCRFLGGRCAADIIPQPEFAPPKTTV